jgi:hypothetical protein
MKTSVIFGLLLIFVMPTTAPAQSPLPKEGSGTMDASITEDGSIGAVPFGSPSSQSVDGAAGSDVLLVTLLVQGMALAFLFWKLLGTSRRQGSTLRRALTCPVRGREVIAEFQLDLAERPIDVVWCTAFRPAVVMECRKQCLRMQPVRRGAQRAEVVK